MNPIDMILMAVRNLLKRKLRTSLTVLGVIIGTASIVVMVSIGIGVNKSYEAQLSEWGSLYTISVYVNRYHYEGSQSEEEVVLDENAIQDFLNIPGVEAATPVVQNYMILGAGKYISDCSFYGVDPNFVQHLGITLSKGRFLEEGDKNGIIIGEYVLDNFRNPRLSWEMQWRAEPVVPDPFEEKMIITYDWSYGTNQADKSIKPVKVNTVGVLQGGGEYGYAAIMALDDFEKIVEDMNEHQNSSGSSSQNRSSRKKSYDNALIKCYDVEDVLAVEEQVRNLGFECYSMADNLESVKEMSNMLQMVLGAIGAVSLFVAAIGITNTMVMSIYERTREIGIMKVIGASLKDIQNIFLTEAAFIGLTGGVLGIILGYVVSFVLNTYAGGALGIVGAGQALSVIPLWLALAAAAFSTFVGILAGFLPARRAMHLSALSAIKTE